MFKALAAKWCPTGMSPSVVADKVKFFFDKFVIQLCNQAASLARVNIVTRMYFQCRYKMNRHKMTTLTPSYHAEA